MEINIFYALRDLRSYYVMAHVVRPFVCSALAKSCPLINIKLISLRLSFLCIKNGPKPEIEPVTVKRLGKRHTFCNTSPKYCKNFVGPNVWNILQRFSHSCLWQLSHTLLCCIIYRLNRFNVIPVVVLDQILENIFFQVCLVSMHNKPLHLIWFRIVSIELN